MEVGASVFINRNFKLQFFSPISNQSDRYNSHFTVIRMSTTSNTHHQTYWASLQADVEAHLKQAIPTTKQPPEVFEPMHHLAFAAPKTTVPALCVAACELVGGQRHQAMAAASALLLIQAATYAHEHLPLTDRPRPRPKPNPESTVYRPGIELLTGDGITPFGFELLARSDDPAQGNSERILRVMIEISRAVGSEGLIDAQYRKAMLSDGEEMRHVESIKGVVEKNEGALHACGAACGGVLGGGSEEEIEKLRKLGFYVGVMQGMLQWGFNEQVEEARNLALQELNFFKDREIDVISSFINV